MVYKVLGLMSGSSMDGLDMAFVLLEETGGKWSYEIIAADCTEYDEEWRQKLQAAPFLSAKDYLVMHTAYGRYTGEKINAFIDRYRLHYQVGFIASHGHTIFHFPTQHATAQLGDGATIAAVTALPVISDLRAMDVALGGQGAPIVPVGEKYLFGEYDLLLNIGGIANLSFNNGGHYSAFDICPANRVLNELAGMLGKKFDEDGQLAAGGSVQDELLERLNALDYYEHLPPKSLANEFGTGVVLPLINSYTFSVQAKLRTYVEHIAVQTANAVKTAIPASPGHATALRMLVTGGGAFNTGLLQRMEEFLIPRHISVIVPERKVVQYKEALIMAFIGALRWRQENTTLASVTGASRDSIGGALWMGHVY